MIECNCDNLHTFTYSVCNITYESTLCRLHTYIIYRLYKDRNLVTKIGKIFGSGDLERSVSGP